MADNGIAFDALSSNTIEHNIIRSSVLNIFILFVLPLICAIGFIGNGMVCIAIGTDRRLQNITNYFLFSLALADLLVCAIVMPLAILAEINQGMWKWSYPLCFLYAYSDVFLCSASIVHMSVISLDRFLGISQPLKNRNKSRNIVIFKICVVWIITTIISSPLAALAIYDPTTILNDNTCMITNRLYVLYGSILSFIIPFITMTVTYIKTTQLLTKQASLLSQRTNDRFHNGLRRTLPHRKLGYANSYSMGNSQANTTVGHKTSVISYNSYNAVTSSLNQTPKQSQNGDTKCLLHQSYNSSSTDTDDQQISKKTSFDTKTLKETKLEKQSSAIRLQIGKLKTRTSSVLTSITTKVNRKSSLQTESMELANEHKATRVLAVVFSCFFICWTPFFIANLAYATCGTTCEVPKWLGLLFLWLGYISSTINPIIYTIFNRRFRQAFLRILRCQCMHSYRDQMNYSRTHTHIPPDTHTWSNFDKSVNGKEIGRTMTPPFKNTTALGLIAAGSRAISAPAGPLMLPAVSTLNYCKKKDTLESPDSIESIEWNDSTSPLKRIPLSSLKNKPGTFPIEIQNEDINISQESSPKATHKNSGTYRSRPDEKSKAEQNMQISDYDNLKSDEMRQQSVESSDSDDGHGEYQPLITQNSNKQVQTTSPKRFFSSFKNSPLTRRRPVTCPKCETEHLPRSVSDKFSEKTTISPTLLKKKIIKSTTVSEQLSECLPNKIEPNAFIVATSKEHFHVLKIKSSNISNENPVNVETPIDNTVKSGLFMRSNDQIHETYL